MTPARDSKGFVVTQDAYDALLRSVERLTWAANRIASWGEGDTVTGSFDEPASAEIARAALSRPIERQIPREPTVEMLRVNVQNWCASHYAGEPVMCSGCQLGEIWRAMYDAALPPPPSGDSK